MISLIQQFIASTLSTKYLCFQVQNLIIRKIYYKIACTSFPLIQHQHRHLVAIKFPQFLIKYIEARSSLIVPLCLPLTFSHFLRRRVDETSDTPVGGCIKNSIQKFFLFIPYTPCGRRCDSVNIYITREKT